MLCRSKPETEYNVIPYHFDAAVDIFLDLHNLYLFAVQIFMSIVL